MTPGTIIRVEEDGLIRLPANIVPMSEAREVLVQVSPDGSIILKPIDPDQRWFWTREWQQGEIEAEAEIKSGNTEHFDSEEAFLDALD
jgi:hypothetical protein